jgi:hypothetical protein
LVYVGGVEFEVWWRVGRGENGEGDGAGAAGVVVDDGAGGDWGDESEVMGGELGGDGAACCFVDGDFAGAGEEGFGLFGHVVDGSGHLEMGTRNNIDLGKWCM